MLTKYVVSRHANAGLWVNETIPWKHKSYNYLEILNIIS
jgi:hypothetical protein